MSSAFFTFIWVLLNPFSICVIRYALFDMRYSGHSWYVATHSWYVATHSRYVATHFRYSFSIRGYSFSIRGYSFPIRVILPILDTCHSTHSRYVSFYPFLEKTFSKLKGWVKLTLFCWQRLISTFRDLNHIQVNSFANRPIYWTLD